jgi:hypothetical protein
MKKVFYSFLFVLLTFGIAEAGNCIRCEGQIACVGDSKFDLIKKCGQPAYSERVSTETEGSVSGGSVNLSEQDVEKFYYTFGGLIMDKIVTIRNGKIVEVERD